MEAKQKAKELYNKFQVYAHANSELPEYAFKEHLKENAKECALIAVDEILDFMILTMKWSENHNGNVHYWQEVKQEIENL